MKPNEVYKIYSNELGGKIPRRQFHALTLEYNRLLVDRLLEGQSVSLGKLLGSIRIVKNKNTFKNPKIDWGASNKYRKELEEEGTPLYDKKTGKGTKWIIYHMPEYRFMFLWERPRKVIRNSAVFRFHPVRTSRKDKFPGPVDRLARLVNEDELAYLKFKTNAPTHFNKSRNRKVVP